MFHVRNFDTVDRQDAISDRELVAYAGRTPLYDITWIINVNMTLWRKNFIWKNVQDNSEIIILKLLFDWYVEKLFLRLDVVYLDCCVFMKQRMHDSTVMASTMNNISK